MIKTLKIKKNIIFLSIFIFIILIIFALFNNENQNINNYIPWLIIISILSLNIITGLLNENSSILSYVLLIVLLILMASTNNDNGANTDFYAYNKIYTYFLEGGSIQQASEIFVSDYGFMLLMKIGSLFRLSYNWFLFFISILSMLLIRSTICKITKNYNFILALFAITPFTYDVYQIRFFLAYSIVVYAFKFLIFDNNHNIIKYSLIIGLASFIHFSMIFYLLFLLIYFEKFIRKYYIFITGFFFLSYIFCYVTGINIINILFHFISIKRATQYANFGINISIFTSMFIISMMLFFIYASNLICKKSKLKYANSIFLMNIILTCLFPFLAVSLEFERYLRPILILNYALIVASTEFIKKVEFYKLALSILILVIAREGVMIRLTDNIIHNNYIVSSLFENK